MTSEHEWVFLSTKLPILNMQELLERVKGTRIPEAVNGMVTFTLGEHEIPGIVGSYISFLESAKNGRKLVRNFVNKGKAFSGDPISLDNYDRFSRACKSQGIKVKNGFSSTSRFLNALFENGHASEKDIKRARKIISSLQ